MVCDLLSGTQGEATGSGFQTSAPRRAAGERITSCLFCTDVQGELYETVREVKACGHREPGWLIIDWGLVRQLCRFVREQRVDLLHAHNHAPNLYCTLTSLLTGVPVVVTRHGRGYHTFRWRLLARVLSWRSKAVVFVSEDARRLAIATGSVSAKKAIVIHNGIDTRQFAPCETTNHRPTPQSGKTDIAGGGGDGSLVAMRAKLGIPADAVVIGSVGRLSQEKNYPLLLRAFSRLVRAESINLGPETLGRCEALGERTSSAEGQSNVYRPRSNVYSLLVGDGLDRGRIEAEIDRVNLKDRFIITGMQSTVLSWLHAMDVFCLSSDTEGLSISLLEAGACGLPSVVTDVGGNREIVQDGVSGFIVPQGDEVALASKMKRLVDDVALRHAMGAAARELVEAQFSFRAMVDAYADIYEKALS
ncbi:MAG: glycosyltransferase [bacterium]